MRALYTAVLASVLLAACTFPNHRTDLRITDPVDTGGDGFSNALLQSVGVEMKPGNEVELLDNGRVFDAMVEEIQQAEVSVHIVTFIWRPSSPSDRIIEALVARRPGVSCRVVVDPIGSIDFDEKVRMRLNDAGCDVRKYHPLGPGSVTRLTSRNHRKMVIVDGKVGITGGWGIWRSWEGDGMEKDNWRDTSVRIWGPAVRDMQLAFAENWQEAGGSLLPPIEFPKLEERGSARAAYVGSTSAKTLSDAERMTQVALAAAKWRIWIANSYFIPSTAIGDTLVRKQKLGVDIRVLCPGPVHDIPPVRAAQRTTYDRLLEAGVRIWEYQPSMMHAKTMLIDDRIVVVGSTNLDPLSMKNMEEGSLVIESPELAQQVENSWRKDFRYALEVQPKLWKDRPMVERVARQLTALFGAFL